MDRLPIDINRMNFNGKHFWAKFKRLTNVLGIETTPNKFFTPTLMKAVCMGERYFLMMEAKMETDCPACVMEFSYGEKIEPPHPVCAYFKTHPHELYDHFWGASALGINDVVYKKMQRGALNELKFALLSDHKPAEWTDGVSYEDLVKEMNLYHEENFQKNHVDHVTRVYMKHIAMGDKYRV